MDAPKEYHIHLIRHGITEGNQKQLYYGSTDISITEEGGMELDRLAQEGLYPCCEQAALYTSGLLRTEETLARIYGEREHGVLEDFQEFDFGEFEMKTHQEIVQHADYHAWVSDKTGETCAPGGESMNRFHRRICDAFSRLLAGYERGEAQRDTILVCHGGVIVSIMKHCFPEEKEELFQWMPDPGHGYSIRIRDGRPVSCSKF